MEKNINTDTLRALSSNLRRQNFGSRRYSDALQALKGLWKFAHPGELNVSLTELWLWVEDTLEDN